ncbi:MAG: phospholipid carrier-dependent glycosyltransferase, partial [Deltaproteobacteria bacterium]
TIRDELIAHLAYPKIFLRAGRIVELPFTSFSYYPLGLDLLFGMAMSCASDIAARLLHAGVGILSLWGLYLVARRICGRGSALWATFFFAQLPLVVLTGGKAYVDMGVILYLMGALLAFDDHVRGGGRGALVRSGIFLGLAFGVKYNALLFVPVFCFALLWRLARKPPRQALIEGAALFLPFLLVASPWMIRNLWLTGNPLFPFYNGIFHGKELMPGLETIPELQFRVETMGWGAQFLIPWLVSVEMTGREVYAADGIIGPLFLVFAPFGWFVLRRRPTLLKFLGFVTLGYFVVAWFIGGVRLRYYLPMLPFCAILAARGWRFFLRVKGIRTLAIVVGGGLIAYNFIVSTTYLRQADPWPFLLGVQDRESYLLQHLPDYRYMKFMNERLPTDATVMLIHSNRGYYLDRDYRYDAKFGGYTLKRILRESRSAEEMTCHFRERGISHLYIDLRGLQTDLGADPLGKDREKMAILQRFLFGELDILLQDGRAMIAALPPEKG